MKIFDETKGGVEQATVQEIVSRMSELFKPADDRTVAEILDDGFVLPEGGRFDSTITPYMVEPVNWLKDRGTHSIVYSSPARCGKTVTLIVGGVYYIITQDPSDTMIVHMTDATARKFSKLSIARMIYNSPLVRAVMPASRDDDNILSKFFRNGMALIIGYPAPSQLAGTDFKYMLMTDVDRNADENSDGDSMKQADKRTQTFGSSGKLVVESSPSRDLDNLDWTRKSRHEAPPVGGITAQYNAGDRRIEYWECTECAEDFPLYPDYELFCLPDKKDLIAEMIEHGIRYCSVKYAVIYCPNCGSELNVAERQIMAKDMKWKPENEDAPVGRNKSYWGSGYSAGFQTWQSILYEYCVALMHYHNTGDEGKLKATFNLDMGGIYLPISMESRMSAEELKAKAVDIGERVIPDGVRYLIANIDTQKWKYVVDIQGVGVGNKRWIIDRFDVSTSTRSVANGGGFEFIQPATYEEDWDLITEQVLEKKYMLSDGSGREMRIHHTVCDMQGVEGVTLNAYKYLKRLKSLGLADRFSLLRGERPNPNSNNPLFIKAKVDRSSNAGVKARVVGMIYFYRVNTTMGKDIVMSQLKREDKGSGSIIFSKNLEDHVFDECLVEVRTDKGWTNPMAKRNEQFDLLNYGNVNIGIIESTQMGKMIDWLAPPHFAKEWDENTNISSESGADTLAKKKMTDRDRLLASRQRGR